VNNLSTTVIFCLCRFLKISLKILFNGFIKVLYPEEVRMRVENAGTLKLKEMLAGGRGFEPRVTGPEPVVLPLYNPPVKGENLLNGQKCQA
jgi:hypothetical protein